MIKVITSHCKWLNWLIVITVLTSGLFGTAKPVAAEDYTLELMTTVSGPGHTQAWFIEAIRGLQQTPHHLLLAVQNIGADCGDGTPSSIWEVTLDPVTNRFQRLEHKQFLDEIQSVRRSLFEGSEGTLFTGSGWCGFKPAYYSTDGGAHWQTADMGSVVPPNSVFMFGEINGRILAGTGYNPYPAELYHWLGNGQWERVFTSPWPGRSIVSSMVTHRGALFVSTQLYAVSGGEGAAVWISSDGRTFTPTTGIPANTSVWELAVAGDDLVAFTWTNESPAKIGMYHWNDRAQSWELVIQYGREMTWKISGKNLIGYEGALYGYARAAGDPTWGIYRSVDLGRTWQLLAPLASPEVNSLAGYEGSIYIGTWGDNQGKAYLYRLTPTTERRNVISNPGFERGVWAWKFYTDGQGALSNDSPGYQGVAAGRVDIDEAGRNVQLYQAGFPLDPATRYRLQFAARSSTEHDLAVYLHQDSSPYVNYRLRNFRVNLTDAWKLFTVEFTTAGFTSPTTDTRLRFWLAPFDANGDVYWLDQISLKRVETAGTMDRSINVGHIAGLVQGIASPITVRLADLEAAGAGYQAARLTDATGAFRFEQVPAGLYELWVESPTGYLQPEPVQLLIGEEANEEFVFTLTRITDSDYLPLISR
jgi:hypothetical protein